MQVELEVTGSCSRKLSVTIPVGDVDATYDSVLREYAKKVTLPGFRRGKAPRSLLAARFRDELGDEVRSRLVGESLAKAIDEHKVSPVEMPRVEPGELAQGSDFSYTAEFDIAPEVELKTYKGLKVPEVAVEVTDEEVEGQLQELAKRSAQLAPVLDHDVVREGDVVLLDYQGTMGGVPIEGAAAENALVEIGAEGYIPGFADGLVGAKVPGERVLPIDFPENYRAQDLAGKSATFAVTLKELKKKDIPALDDAFAQDHGKESLDELRAETHKRLSEQKSEAGRQKQRKKLLLALVAANPLEVPKSAVIAQSRRMVQASTSYIEQAIGHAVELTDSERAELEQGSHEGAAQSVRSGLLLQAVSQTEDLVATDEELEAHIDQLAQQTGELAPRVRAFYADEEARESLRLQLAEDKTVKFLLEHANIVPEDECAPSASEEEAAEPVPGDEVEATAHQEA